MLTHDDLIALCGERSEIGDKVVPYINAVAANLPPWVKPQTPMRKGGKGLPRTSSSTGSSSSRERSSNHNSSQDDDDEEYSVPDGPAVSVYDTNPALKAIQPQLNDFDQRLTEINEKLDRLLAASG